MTAGPDDRHYSSQEIAAELRLAIATNELAPGDQLPSNADLQQKYSVARQTAQNVINALKAEGIVYSVPGRGIFVRSDLDTDELLATMAEAEDSSPLYRDLLNRLDNTDTTIDKITDVVRDLTRRLDALEKRQDRSNGPAGQ
ncbi:MAG: GntR family transcriptional regulator [bacterium]|nr:GntR family transcriptional regulator [bacterium]